LVVVFGFSNFGIVPSLAHVELNDTGLLAATGSRRRRLGLAGQLETLQRLWRDAPARALSGEIASNIYSGNFAGSYPRQDGALLHAETFGHDFDCEHVVAPNRYKRILFRPA
jgi:hypothetical protein